MRIPVITAVPGAEWEADLVAQLGRANHGVTVVRRCVDIAELLSTAASGTARAALVSTDLRRLDRDTVSQLASAGVAAVGLVHPGDAAAAHLLQQLGVHRIVPADAGAEAVARAVVQAVADAMVTSDASVGAASIGDPAAAFPPLGPVLRPPPPPPGRGRIVAVWGPTGAPGRTTVSVGLADETARLGVSTLLVDADVYGGTVAQMLGLLDESSGLAIGCHAAASGRLDVADLAALCRRLRPTLRVLTGPARADRWPELRPTAVLAVLDQARHLAAATIVDCGFCIEQDEEVGYDTAAPRRNGATVAVLRAADTVVCVGSADPVGLRRLVRGIEELKQAVQGVQPLVVVNRVRATVVPGEPRREIDAALGRWAGVAASAYLPAAPAVVDTAMRTGATLAEAAPDSPLRRSVAELARRLAGLPAADDSRRRLRLTRRR
jgi:MinD-like ATPase involved in chromosome partitioning or flagellar assembly